MQQSQIKVKSKLKFGKLHSLGQQLFLEIRVSKLPTKQQILKFGLLVKFHSLDPGYTYNSSQITKHPILNLANRQNFNPYYFGQNAAISLFSDCPGLRR